MLASAVLFSGLAPLTSQPATAQAVIYVHAGASGAADGSSWADAYKNLQEALGQAQSAPGPVQIWVAEGTYRPTRLADPTDARTATFQLLSGVELYGGFNWSETSRSGRNPDPETNGTVLSGDIGSVGFTGDNAYHVVTGSGVGPSAILDGFTITAGRANGAEYDDRDGSGMYNDMGSPTLRNCQFMNNRAQGDGGAMYNWFESSPSIANCVFEDNVAGFGGGAISNSFESSPYLEEVLFSENSAGLSGGALSNFNSSPQLLGVEFKGNVSGFAGGAMENSYNSSAVVINVRFVGNAADYWGGALANDDSDPRITNAVFSGNKANDGGAVHNETSSPILTNVTFSGNRADNGIGGGTGGANANTSESYPQIRNSILWGNSALGSGHQLSLDENSQPLVGHSIVEDGLPSGTFDDGQNLNSDPRFDGTVDPGTAPTVAGNLRVRTDGAPGLDAADASHLPDDVFDLDNDGNTTEPIPLDLEGTSRLVDNNADGTAAPDIGAYEAPSSVLPVELASLDAKVDGQAVRLSWQTVSETGNAGFGVERKAEEMWATIGFVEGAGTTSEAKSYRFVDQALTRRFSKMSYRLRQVDLDGSVHYSEAVEVELAPPTELRLYAPYPNPSRGQATVHFDLPEGTGATLSIYDVTGRRVALLPQGEVLPGRQRHHLDTSGLASGLYLLRLSTETHSVSQKMSVVK